MGVPQEYTKHTECAHTHDEPVRSLPRGAPGPAGPHGDPIRTTMTVTLSAEPRCTALLASLLQAAS